MRGETGVDKLAMLQQGWTLMLVTTFEQPFRVVPGGDILERYWEVWSVGKSGRINSVDVVSSIEASLFNVALIPVGLDSQVPGLRVGVDNTSSL